MNTLLLMKKKFLEHTVVNKVANYFSVKDSYLKKNNTYSFITICICWLTAISIPLFAPANGFSAGCVIFFIFLMPIIGFEIVENHLKKTMNIFGLIEELKHNLSDKHVQAQILQPLLDSGNKELEFLAEELAQLFLSKKYETSIVKIKKISAKLEKIKDKQPIKDYYISLGLSPEKSIEIGNTKYKEKL